MTRIAADSFARRTAGGGKNLWLGPISRQSLGGLQVQSITPEILETEGAVGLAMLEELKQAAAEKAGDLVIILLGGRGAQELHRILGRAALTSQLDDVLGRLHLFTQDALAPLPRDNEFSFVRDFERLLGEAFFAKIKSFTPMPADSPDPLSALEAYLNRLESLGGIDIFFLGLGPEDGGASHLAYIKPGSGATVDDLAGIIPISSSILEHHIAKFKAGGARVNPSAEAECRAATHILTLGPAAILRARRIVQSIVDASTAPAKRQSYRRLLEEEVLDDEPGRAGQLDRNPGLWLRLHPNVRSLVLPDVFEA